MTCYIGSLGRLVPISATASLSSGIDRPVSEETTLGGRRFVRMAPRGNREWSVRTPPGTPAGQLSAPDLFTRGAWGDGPWWWLSDWAVAVNALTPSGSVLTHAGLAGGVSAGPVQAADGTWFPSSAVSPAAGVNAVARSALRGYTAIPTGTPYTASMYVSAGQRVRVSEFDSTLGVTLRSVESTTGAGVGLSRVTVSSIAGTGTTALRIDVRGAGVCAGAALSFTRTLAAWGVGDGCEEAVLMDLSSDVTAPWMGFAEQGYRVLEVGG